MCFVAVQSAFFALRDEDVSLLSGPSMSLPCLLGMHDIIWNNSSSSSFRPRNHVRSLEKTMNSARSSANITTAQQNIDGFANVLRLKNQSSNNLEFLLQTNGGESFRPRRSSQDGFRAGHWSVSDGTQPEVNP